MGQKLLTDDQRTLLIDLQSVLYNEEGIIKKELSALENSFKDYGITTQEKAQYRTQFSIAIIQTIVPTILSAALDYALLEQKIETAKQGVLTEKEKTKLTERQRKAFDDDILRISVEKWADIAAMAVSVESATAQDTIDKFENVLTDYASISCSKECTDENSIGKQERDDYLAEKEKKENDNGDD